MLPNTSFLHSVLRRVLFTKEERIKFVWEVLEKLHGWYTWSALKRTSRHLQSRAQAARVKPVRESHKHKDLKSRCEPSRESNGWWGWREARLPILHKITKWIGVITTVMSQWFENWLSSVRIIQTLSFPLCCFLLPFHWISTTQISQK